MVAAEPLDLEVRRLSEPEIAAVIKGLASRPPERHRERLADQARGGFVCLVAWLGDHPAGSVGMAFESDASAEELCESGGLALVRDLFVEPPFRRRGAGRALMKALETEARAMGAHGVVLDTGTDDEFTAARELYRSLGYVDQAGVYLGGWSDPHRAGVHLVDALTLWRKPLWPDDPLCAS